MPRHRTTAAALLAGALLLNAAAASAQDDAEAARRKKLIRLGSGVVNLPAPIGEVYPLEALIERCMEVNPQVVARQHSELYAQYRKDEADWALFPSFQFNTNFTIVPEQTDPNRVTSNIEKYLAFEVGPFSSSSLRIIVPIFTFGKIDAAQELAGLGVDQQALETRKLRLKLLTQTREAYYSLQLGKQIQGLIGDSVEIIREEIERQEEAREFGDEQVDVEQLRKLQIYETEISARILDNGRLVTLTKGALAALVQLPRDGFDVPPFDEEMEASPLLPLAEYQQVARENRPEIALLEKAVAARKQQVNLEEANFWPDIFFATDISHGYSTEEIRVQRGFVVNEDGTQLPLEVEPLFDPYNYLRFGFLFGARLNLSPMSQYYQLKQAQSQLAETQGQREAALEGIALQIEKQWVEVDADRQKVEIYQRRYKAADRWRKQTGIAFESGGAEFKDFLAPLQAFYEARLKLLEAQYNYLVGMAKLGELIGVTDIQALGEAKKPSK